MKYARWCNLRRWPEGNREPVAFIQETNWEKMTRAGRFWYKKMCWVV